MAKSRLEEQQAIADAKARDAAMTIKREQDFGAAIASGMPVMEAYQRFPVSASMLNAIGRTQAKTQAEEKLAVREGRFPIVTINPRTGEAKQVWTPEKKPDESLIDFTKPSGASESPGIISRIKNVFSPSGPTPPPIESKFGHPKVGEVRFGYRFKGGDPSDQKNWEPVKEGP
jgi:hypothetical protein